MVKHEDPDLVNAQTTLTTTSRRETKTVDHLQPTKYGSFLDYPFEIRAMVYEDFLGPEFCEVDEGKEEFGQPPPRDGGPRLLIEYNDEIEAFEEGILRRMTAYDKVSLLLANKAVLKEALPVFHKLHVFQLPQFDKKRTLLRHPEKLPSCIRQVLQAIAKVHLVRRPGEDDDHYTAAYHVKFLVDACPNLNSLSVGITIIDSNFPRLEDQPPERYPLEQLWPRLKYLQLNVTYWYLEQVCPHLEVIAPGIKWSWYKNATEDIIFDGPDDPPTQNRVFYLDRAHLEEGVTEMDDESPPDSDDDASIDDASIDSVDDASVDSGDSD